MNRILKKNVMKRGRRIQTRKCVEEVGEFLQALSKYKFAAEDRLKGEEYETIYRKAADHLNEEIADCIIMFEQMQYIYGAGGEGIRSVEQWKEYKLRRLAAELYKTERK